MPVCRKTCPTHRGLRRLSLSNTTTPAGRKTCPTHRGLRLHVICNNHSNIGRKTCPTHRGLRPLFLAKAAATMCRKTCPTHRGLRLSRRNPSKSQNVGRLAPLIGDKNQTALMTRSIKAVFASGVLSSCLDNAVLPVAEYRFFAQVQPLPDIQHL